MRRNILAAALQVVAEPLDQPQGVGKLQVGVETAIEDAIVHGVGMTSDVSRERDDGPLELGEDRFELCGGHARLAAIDECVVGSLVVTDRVRDSPIQLDVLFEVGSEQAEVILAASLLPDRLRHAAGVGNLRDELGWELGRFVEVASRDAHQACFVGVERQLCDLVLELVEQPAHLVGGEPHMRQPRQGRHLFGAGLHAAGRHVRLLVPLEERSSSAEIGDLGQYVLQRLEPVLRVARHPLRVFSRMRRSPR